MNDLRDMQQRIARNNFAKGWRGDDQPERSFGDEVALIHSEASEALEEFRDGHHPSEIYFVHGCRDLKGLISTTSVCSDGNCFPKPEGAPIEFADILVRILDCVDKYGFDLQEAMDYKMFFNEQRPHRHGGKKL